LRKTVFEKPVQQYDVEGRKQSAVAVIACFWLFLVIIAAASLEDGYGYMICIAYTITGIVKNA
jgi:hypothetical protein